ncbi:serine-tRNA ligase [Boletus reticuloceps]|uniref:Seryl-tRNA(Ser) synthetase n=1 Tax=Boletus reticuloceps TaxID=495285 RepID=A0A8I2YZS5_9AGAM|nr:serine-tRNA ligase [Boletus reticuloceps]
MTLDVLSFIDGKGGNAEEIRESQRKRGEPVELVDQVIEMYAEWVKLDYELNGLNKQVNAVQKEIGAKKKAKEPADDLVAQKKSLDTQVEAKRKETREYELLMRQKASNVGNIVAKDVPVSLTEDDNVTLRTWHPDGPNGQVEKKTVIMPHHEVLLRLDAMDLERGKLFYAYACIPSSSSPTHTGAKIVGHRGFFFTDDGVDLNQALISYALDFLRKRDYKRIQPPFMVNKDIMGKTAQLSQFDEELYKVIADEDEKYLIATSEQPIRPSMLTNGSKTPKPNSRSTTPATRPASEKKPALPVAICGASFASTSLKSEAFYQSLGLPYRVVAIVSGALNLAASKKCDLEAWFPFQGAHKELVSCSNCTDYQSRRLEVRCGLKSKDQQRKVYVHMLNGTMCATTRTLCCVAENYQTPDGLVIPEVLRPYMQGTGFLTVEESATQEPSTEAGIIVFIVDVLFHFSILC